MIKTYQLLQILLAAMALWILSYGKSMCPSPVCGYDTRASTDDNRSSHTESQVSGLDPRIEYILQYFKAMHTVRGDIDSIASSANIDIQYLHHLARTSTDIPHSLVPDLSLIPDEGDFSMPCRNKGPCSSPGYYKCNGCVGETDNVLTMDTIEPVNGVCLGCECRDQGALLKAAESYLGLVKKAGRIILTGVHREHTPFTYGQLANPTTSGACAMPRS